MLFLSNIFCSQRTCQPHTESLIVLLESREGSLNFYYSQAGGEQEFLLAQQYWIWRVMMYPGSSLIPGIMFMFRKKKKKTWLPSHRLVHHPTVICVGCGCGKCVFKRLYLHYLTWETQNWILKEFLYYWFFANANLQATPPSLLCIWSVSPGTQLPASTDSDSTNPEHRTWTVPAALDDMELQQQREVREGEKKKTFLDQFSMRLV